MKEEPLVPGNPKKILSVVLLLLIIRMIIKIIILTTFRFKQWDAKITRFHWLKVRDDVLSTEPYLKWSSRSSSR